MMLSRALSPNNCFLIVVHSGSYVTKSSIRIAFANTFAKDKRKCEQRDVCKLTNLLLLTRNIFLVLEWDICALSQ